MWLRSCSETVSALGILGPEDLGLLEKSAVQYLNVAKAALRLSVPLVSSVRKTQDSWISLQYLNDAKAVLRLSVTQVSKVRRTSDSE